MGRRSDDGNICRRGAAGLVFAGVLLLAGCGVRSNPARPGNYNYPASYPKVIEDPIIAPGDAPTAGTAPVLREGRQDRPTGTARDSYSATGTPPPATETTPR